MDNYIEKFVQYSKDKNYEPTVYFHEMREMLCAISLRAFCGNYIREDQIRKIADDYYLVTAALELVNFPIIIPYTKTWYGKKTADMAMKIFENCAQQAKDYIAAGGEPKCVMDAWCKLMHDASKEKNDPDSQLLHREFSNKEISEAIFTMLFASQDASSSLCYWLFQIVADRPDVLAKVREEQLKVRGGDPNKPVTLEMIEEMKYTTMVIKECLSVQTSCHHGSIRREEELPSHSKLHCSKGRYVDSNCLPTIASPRGLRQSR